MNSEKQKLREQKRARNARKTPTERIYAAIDWTMEHLSWLPTAVGGVAVLVSGVLFVLAPKKDGFDYGLIAWGVAFSLISIAMQVLVDQWRRQSAQNSAFEGAQLQLSMSDAIAPIVRELAKMNFQPRDVRQRTLVKIHGLAVTAMNVMLPKVNRPRLTIFKAVPAQGPRRRRIEVDHSAGRGDEPRVFKDADGGRGEAVHRWLESGGTKFCADVRLSTDPGVDPKSKGYRTFIAARIMVDQTAYGMLCIDAPEPGDLDETDKPLVEVLAELLAAAYAAADRN